LDHLNPHLVLERGYSVVRDSRGTLIRGSAQIASGAALNITFAQGAAEAQVIRTSDE
jgi:exodeoxyribonuclease VII large subunit